MKYTFEDYLKHLHSLNYMGTDDNMPESFESWLSQLDTEELMKYADDAMQKHMSINELKYKNLILKRKNPTKTFIGGLVIGIFIGLFISAVFIHLTLFN